MLFIITFYDFKKSKVFNLLFNCQKLWVGGNKQLYLIHPHIIFDVSEEDYFVVVLYDFTL